MANEQKISDKEAEIEAKIQAVYDSLRILPVSEPDIDKLLNMGPQELARLTQSDCNERAYRLFCHNLLVQKRINFLTSKKRWAENNLRFIVARGWKNFGGNNFSKYELIRDQVATENGAAFQLMKLVASLDIEIDALSFITSRIKDIADTLNSLSYSKRQ